MKEIFKSLKQPLLVTLVLMLICGFGFPLLMTGISQLTMSYQANGSLIMVDGKAVGSEHVGQQFTESYYLKGRPSAYQYNTYTEAADGKQYLADGSEFAGVSSGSNNYGPSNLALIERVEADIERVLAENPTLTREDIPVDLVTASGSGLDPHISVDAAMVQLPAISEASGLSVDELTDIVKENTEGKLLSVFGEEVVNVLNVNIDIYEAMQNK